MSARPLQTIPVGVIVERTKGVSAWIDFIWRPAAVLAGEPDTPPWTSSPTTASARRSMRARRDRTVSLRDDHYRDNLAIRRRRLCGWCCGRRTPSRLTVAAVTADPAEGEGLTEAATDLVEQVPMPEAIRQLVAAFVAEHHVEQPFVKRKRDRADPEALGRRAPTREVRRMSEPETFSSAGRAASAKRRTHRRRPRRRPAAFHRRRSARRERRPKPPSIPPACRRSNRSRRHRRPRLSPTRRSGGTHPCGASSRMVRRSGDSRFRRLG